MAKMRELEAETQQRQAPAVTEVAAAARTAQADRERLEKGSSATTWSEAGVLWNQLRLPHSAAVCRWRQAEAMLRDKDPAGAETLLEAHQAALMLQFGPLAGAIEQLAARARVALPETAGVGAPSPVGAELPAAAGISLTGRERQVLDLLEQQATNRDIAEALFISEKTASVHVSHILAKLGVNNRREAARLAPRLRT